MGIQVVFTDVLINRYEHKNSVYSVTQYHQCLVESKINKKKAGVHGVWLRAKRVVILARESKRSAAFECRGAGAPLIFKDYIPLRRARDSILLTSLVMS